MKDNEQLERIANSIQQECHYMVNSIMANTKATYQDATNIFLFNKLAELQLKINKLEQKETKPDDIEKFPLKGICGKCANYKDKLDKNCLCEHCLMFGVKPLTTNVIPEDIKRLTKLR